MKTSQKNLQQTYETLKNELSVLKRLKNEWQMDTGNKELNGFKGTQNSSQTPIGFYSDKQILEMESNRPKYSDPQIKTSATKYEDKYTVEHTYLRGNLQKSVRYTISMVNARINQYSRTLAEAKDRKMSAETIVNRTKWLKYWQGKQEELEKKCSNT